MKHIKLYEGFLDKLYEKLPEGKLALALAKFFNMVKPELKCKYMRNSDGLWVVAGDDIRLIYLEIFSEDVQLTFFAHHKEEYTDNTELDILDFLLGVFDTDIVDADIQKDEISQAISQLTKEEYDSFIRKNDANKYNL